MVGEYEAVYQVSVDGEIDFYMFWPRSERKMSFVYLWNPVFTKLTVNLALSSAAQAAVKRTAPKKRIRFIFWTESRLQASEVNNSSHFCWFCLSRFVVIRACAIDILTFRFAIAATSGLLRQLSPFSYMNHNLEHAPFRPQVRWQWHFNVLNNVCASCIEYLWLDISILSVIFVILFDCRDCTIYKFGFVGKSILFGPSHVRCAVKRQPKLKWHWVYRVLREHSIADSKSMGLHRSAGDRFQFDD